MLSHADILAASLGGGESRVQWMVAGVIALGCLAVYGGMDLFRFSLVRTRAIASVCFREAIRRRVLWLTPLAILGVVIVSQFLRPLDEQDNIRQVSKFCMFASALLVTASSVIMACTNLPKEIDNRVIFTVVTKPTTRLEILLGKIIGFSAVSAAILLIMGVFTWGYLHYRQAVILGEVRAQLQGNDSSIEPATRKTLEHYASAGLLDARYQSSPTDVQVLTSYAKGSDAVRWMVGDSEQIAYIPFKVDAALANTIAETADAMVLELRIPWEQRELTDEELATVGRLADTAGVKVVNSVGFGPLVPDTSKLVDVAKLIPAMVKVGFVGSEFNLLVDPNVMSALLPQPLPNHGKDVVRIAFPGNIAAKILAGGTFYVEILGLSPGTRYALSADAVTLLISSTNQPAPIVIKSQQFDAGKASLVVLHGKNGTNGQQLKGNANGKGAVGVFSFRNVVMPAGSNGKASFELRTGIEKSGENSQSESTTIAIRVVDTATGNTSDIITMPIEARRTAHIEVPREFTAGGNFDLVVQCLTPDHWVGLRNNALYMSSPNMGFGANLFKGYAILWLFSVLVITVSIFCSTFLSWPIAIVLTLLILLGNWGVMQLGDMMNPGVGRQIVGDLFTGAAPAVAETLNRSFEGLTSLVRNVSLLFPDISSFGAMEDIERGNWITWLRMLAPLKVLAMFGLPILGLSYVFFRNKEVAP